MRAYVFGANILENLVNCVVLLFISPIFIFLLKKDNNVDIKVTTIIIPII